MSLGKIHPPVMPESAAQLQTSSLSRSRSAETSKVTVRLQPANVAELAVSQSAKIGRARLEL
jgi:hypothetical protein